MISIADNIHGLNPVVQDAMKRLDPRPIFDLVAQINKSGADMIDINPGYLSKRYEDRVRFLVETVQSATAAKLVLDSPNPRLIETGLSVCAEKPVINCVSMEKVKLDGILPLAADHECELVILLMDESSFSPPGLEEKISLALEIHEHCAAAGVPLERLIFDPVLPSLSWDDCWRRIGEAIKTIRFLSTGAVFELPVRTIVGLSNLRSGSRRYQPVEVDLNCLAMLCGAGLDYGLVDVLEPNILKMIKFVNNTLL
ncbi:MAG: dihydropteroate synthase [Deltaproteobacteria bacterium]|nr:dihydropteroate synthase [Deltaproteobacteria bacterium]